MKGDFSRETFAAEKHFARVLMQQGRVMLDADFNEQSAILLRYIRQLACDVIGPHGGPTKAAGFEVSYDAAKKWMLSSGRYYVDGILIENEVGCSYAEQPHFSPAADDAMTKEGADVVFLYLDVWERAVTYLDDQRLRESALLGPDTCLRSKVVWQVKAKPSTKAEPTGTDCEAELDEVRRKPEDEPRLEVQLKQPKGQSTPCTISPDAQYRGAENHLYRVEIHRGGAAGEATYKWSRENGSVVTAWLGEGGGQALSVASTRGFEAGCWVELCSDGAELRGEPGILVRIARVEAGNLVVDPSTVGKGGFGWSSKLEHPKVRRWDQVVNEANQGTLGDDQALGVQAGKWVDLEDGIQVFFHPDGRFRTGDYWQIVARVGGDSGAIDWMAGEKRGPAGIVHHYAPLAFVSVPDTQVLRPCRRFFNVLAGG